MARRAEVWQAPPETLEHMPEISGNSVNGLGEEERRQPSPFFWHEPQYHPFGEIQGYTIGVMYAGEDAAAIREAFHINENFRPGSDKASETEQFIHRGPDAIEVAPERVERPAAEWSRLVKEFALDHHADLVGIAEMRKEWVFDGFEVKEKYVIVVGVGHDYEEVSQAPSLPGKDNRATVEFGKQYSRAARAIAELSNFIRGQGYETTPYPGPTAQALALSPAAIAAGLGELGKHGSIINRELGSSFRLGGLATDLPLVVDQPEEFGADDFCHMCRVCTEACPPDAIFEQKQTVRGETKWYVNFDECIPYFAESRGCGICIAACPWSRPGVADTLLQKMAKRRAAKEEASG